VLWRLHAWLQAATATLARRVAVVLLLFTLATAWVLWPLPRDAAGHFAHSPHAGPRAAALLAPDVWLTTWILSWVTHALATDPAALFDANIFYPAPWTLALSEHLIGLTPLFAPVYLATDNPVLAHNVTLLLSFALSGAAMCWLVRHWTTSLAAGVVAGFVFAFAPWRLSQLDHIHLLGLYALPLVFVFSDRVLADGRARDVFALAGCVLLQCLSGYYLAYCTVIAVGLYGTITAVGTPVRRVATASVGLGGALGAFGLVSLPYLWAREAGLIPASTELSSLAMGGVRRWSSYVDPADVAMPFVRYQGRLVLVLATIGVATIAASGSSYRPWRRATIVGVLAVGIVGHLLALGPADGEGLYLWLWRHVPGFSLVRVPARFLVLVAFAVAALAGLGWAFIVRRVRDTTGVALTCLLCAGVSWDLGLVDAHIRLAPAAHGAEVPAVYPWLREHGDGEPLLELPVRGPIADVPGARREGRYAYFSTAHWLPQLTGRSGYTPPVHDLLMPLARQLPDERALSVLGKLTGLRWIVVHGAQLPSAQLVRWQTANIENLELVAELGTDRVYRVEQEHTADWRNELMSRQRGKLELATFQGTPLTSLAASDLRADFTRFDVPERVVIGRRAPVRITVRNRGSRTWPGLALRRDGLVVLQLAWRTPRGDYLAQPKMPALRFARDISPGERAAFSLTVPAPRSPGDHRLVAELAQVGGAVGSRVERLIDVAVSGVTGGAPHVPASFGQIPERSKLPLRRVVQRRRRYSFPRQRVSACHETTDRVAELRGGLSGVVVHGLQRLPLLGVGSQIVVDDVGDDVGIGVLVSPCGAHVLPVADAQHVQRPVRGEVSQLGECAQVVGSRGTLENRGEITSAGFGARFEADEPENGRHQVDGVDQRVDTPAGRHGSRQPEDERHAQHLFEERLPMALLTVLEELLTVIGGENDQRVGQPATLLQRRDELSDHRVGRGDLTVVEGNQMIEISREHLRIDGRVAFDVGEIEASVVIGIEAGIVRRRWNVVIVRVPEVHEEEEWRLCILPEPVPDRGGGRRSRDGVVGSLPVEEGIAGVVDVTDRCGTGVVEVEATLEAERRVQCRAADEPRRPVAGLAESLGQGDPSRVQSIPDALHSVECRRQ
jgi:hypothetical protein